MKHFRAGKTVVACLQTQLKRVRDGQRVCTKAVNFRKMRYFTFCAASALDVMLLHKGKVIRSSKDDGFNTVVFFDHNPEAVSATQETIPGPQATQAICPCDRGDQIEELGCEQ